MNHRKRCRPQSKLLLIAAIAFFTLGPGFAQAAPVPCDTGDPCTAGICLEDGTCEATPANNGASCETFNTCMPGVCSNGQCQESPGNNGASCKTFEACRQENGTCSQGECVSAALPDGSACREDVMGPCIIGTCSTFANFSFCDATLKCGEWTDPCALNCNFETGDCETTPTHICDDACTTATCTQTGDYEYACTQVKNRADDTPCNDLSSCNGAQDKCESGECTGSGSPGGAVCGDGGVDAPEQCDDGDTVFEFGDYCDQLCVFVPCGKPTKSSGALPKASDALFALKAAVRSASCDPSVCDVNNNGTITASDALLILKKAVGTAVTLSCPAV